MVSIIGRPNVGKSSLFNRIIGKRLAVVDDMPGVTLDRNYALTEWNGEKISVVDTGGLIPADKSSLIVAVKEQVRIAIAESAVIIFIVDATTGPVDIDLQIAGMLRRKYFGKVICAANKAESESARRETEKFRALGFGTVYEISSLHGSGIAELLDKVVEMIRSDKSSHAEINPGAEPVMRLAIVGRPNSGKSSLVNMLLHKKRMVVDEKPGTTRDSIDSLTTYNGKQIVLIDTAGIRKKSHIKQDMEYYTILRAFRSIERSDICVLMVDASIGIGVQDLRILRHIIDQRKGVLLAWNKWDIVPKDHKTFDTIVKESRRQYKELQFIPMLAISALTGKRTTNIIETAFKIKENLTRRVGNAIFENDLFSWVRLHPHPAIPENPVRFLGAKQVRAPFPLFHIFVSNPSGVSPLYKKYLIKKIYESYDFSGCPVIIDFKPPKKPAGKRKRKGLGEE